VLTKSKSRVLEERSTRKTPLTDADARRLLAQVDEVWIARGRAIDRKPARRAKPGDLKGPTGGYRAPIVRRGGTLLVGFQEAALRELLADRN
jgi:hypothetical protein